MADLFCPVHGEVQATIKEIRARQEARKCLTNESDIAHLRSDMDKIEKENEKQWTHINSLRRMVYMGAGATGVLAFLGSIFGTWLRR